MTATICDTRPCELGEGAFWHPERQQLFWFDILSARLLSFDASGALEWQFDEMHSAAGWIDRDTLLIASETGLWRFDIASGARERVAEIEADKAGTRSNDGRADRHGGFWIGTMGKHAEEEAGAIYRYFDGKVTRLYDNISIPNAICFNPDGTIAYFADTSRQTIWRVALDADGWPDGEPEVFLDLRAEGLFPDGAVTDAEGGLWNAQWGANRVARYLPDGQFDQEIRVGGRHSSCPAFGGPNLRRLYVSTAREGIAQPDAAQGLLYQAESPVAGLPAPRVRA
ncbi:SMP-30/gluconolactonase/LRE family protein [Salipiger bermudensis]|uniref:SMP-30/gluconolactonase/LRE family protein n=1 Tax=Salipiger bermudensis TaxID=344736 RepID=UPI001CD39C6F|nr:SMP-30/gluconolactonase/LRE family protein [Salipiger bermudensis]MCA0963176.1 SMP-30/gluconolactonase/LRE family protein [Salipiger bermudensis]